MELSLLNLVSDCKYSYIDSNVIEDSGLSCVLNVETWSMLKRICSAEEIYERQRLFRALMTTSFYETFNELDKELSSFLRANKCLNDAETICESLFLFAKYYKCFEKLIVLMLNITLADSIFIDRILKYAAKWHKILNEDSYLFGEYTALLSKISSSKIHISGANVFILKNNDANVKTSLIEEINECKKSMGYNGEVLVSQSIRMSLPISETLNLLYQAEFIRLIEIKDFLSSRIDNKIGLLKEEINFYMSVIKLVKEAGEYGIPYSFAEISKKKQYIARDIYDVSLLAKKTINYIPNDAYFTKDEPDFFLLGANGGGKTTYLRAIANNLILFLAGCPVFCKSASIFPFDSVFSHFPADEKFEYGGRFFDEECRVRSIAEKSTENSFVFLNEAFTGADARKGFLISVEVMKSFYARNIFCLFVTHFYEVIDYGFPTLCATVNTQCDNTRTFKIERGVHTRSSYAEDILKKYGLDKESLSIKGVPI